MSDPEIDYTSDQEVSENHSRLIEAVSKLDKRQRVKKPQRSEPSLEVSEFHLVKSGISDKDAVHIDDLAKTLGRKGHHAEISKKLRAAQQKAKVLPKPLEKPAAAKLKRIVGFENAKEELEAWDPIVSKNRAAESMVFPLSQPSMKLDTTEFVKRFRLQSDLEKELAALDPPETVVEEKVDEFPLTLEEIMEKRKEAARIRAQQSYKEAKAHRKNKIKSKKFHRIQRKEKIKKQLKEFEELQKTDPQAALDKLEELDRSRAEERMSLRHKSTGQWAKNKQVRAKYDKDSRQVLAQQLSISKALTQKIRSNVDSDDDDGEVSNDLVKLSANDRDNPWVNGVKTTSEIDDFVTGYRKYWDEVNKASKDNESSVGAEKSINLGSGEKNNSEGAAPEVLPENPVESVTEVYEEAQGSVKKATKRDKSKKKNPRRIEEPVEVPVKRPKVSGRKIQKSTKSEKAGTSEWFVEPLTKKSSKVKPGPKKPIDIDNLFETMEDKLLSRIDAKLKNVKKKLAINAAASKSKVDKNRQKLRNPAVDPSFRKEKVLRPDLDEELDENTGISGNQAMRNSSSLSEDAKIVNGVEKNSEAQRKNDEIDPNKFINVKPKHLKTMMPDTVTRGDDVLDDSEDDENQHNIISEAFADDDVVEEFRKEKAEEVKKSLPEDIDLRLPGWGSWGGTNIVNAVRKKRRFILKFPKEAPRRDENKGDVIIMEEANPKIREHQVSDLPFPFNTVKDFEASIRAPIGRNFVTENAHKRFILPAVKTKMGQIIEPMDAEVLLKKNPKSSKRIPGFKKEKKKNGKIDL